MSSFILFISNILLCVNEGLESTDHNGKPTGGQATLGKMLKHLENKGVIIPKVMKNAYSALYGYTSNEGGIRHGSMEFKDVPAEDAKYMLVSCSAFVNYLIEK